MYYSSDVFLKNGRLIIVVKKLGVCEYNLFRVVKFKFFYYYFFSRGMFFYRYFIVRMIGDFNFYWCGFVNEEYLIDFYK